MGLERGERFPMSIDEDEGDDLSISLLCPLLALFWDQGLIGRALREFTIRRPAKTLAEMSRGHRAAFWLMLLVGGGLVALFGAEGARVFALAAPELFAWAAVIDVALMVEVAAAALAAGRARLAAMRVAARTIVRRLWAWPKRGSRQARARAARTKPRGGPTLDDGPSAQWALA